MENDKTNNIYFPLCCLNYDKDINKTADLLMSYGVVEFAGKLEKEIELNSSDFERIEKYIKDKDPDYVIDKKKYSQSDYFIVLSAIKLGIIIGSLSNTKKQHSVISNYVKSYETKYGKDAKVKLNKDILFEVRDKKFDERMFRVYCAVLSIIGDKIFLRITNKRISYRMIGFKSEDVYYKEKPKYKLLTARQIKTTSDKLSERNFFAMQTYRNRLTFYSTKFRGNEFRKVLENSIALNKAKKEVRNINNQKLNAGVDEKLRQFKEKLLAGESIKEIKSKMELFKAG